MIIITGSIVARPDTFDALRAASLAHVARSRREDGCDHHAVHVDAENPLRLVFFERWRDKAAVLKHFADPDARAFSASAGKLAAAPPDIALYEAEPLPMRALRGGA
jgi:quinol monooxygenase YgiN